MENLTSVINLLGEDNEKRLKDGITDLLLEQVERDLADRYEYQYIIAFDHLFEEVKELVEEEFKAKLTEKYREQMNKRLEQMFSN